MDLVIASKSNRNLKDLKNYFEDNFEHIYSLKEIGFIEKLVVKGITTEDRAFSIAALVKQSIDKKFAILGADGALWVEELLGEPCRRGGLFVNKTEKQKRDLVLDLLINCNDRRARYLASLALFMPNGEIYYGSGSHYGEILDEEVGEGKGYDKIFFSNELHIAMGLAKDEYKLSVNEYRKAAKIVLGALYLNSK